ncbi:Uncharacterised protein [Mycobacteroides abscessus subsp. abscessus]|uniref:Uncharacterized protein n=1 Tax=Gordonia jacobaea TaxID=122202 RepID=A0ABR5I7X3_9ACTN|nr:hypothetical protein ABW18_18860 [Gordonia jacobaea]SKZ76636.1 Uncharacterised protein [Mycobacteroides abscessus subsp. abscessus]
MPVQRPDAHPSLGGDLVERDVDALGVEEVRGRGDQLVVVACGIGAGGPSGQSSPRIVPTRGPGH